MKNLLQSWRGIATLCSTLIGLTLLWGLITHLDEGTALTPRWSALISAWALLTMTLVLDALVRRQDGASPEQAVTIAREHADAARRHAAELADQARTNEASQAAVEAASRLAVSAAAEHAAALVRARRAGLKSLVVGVDGRASTSKLQATLWTYALLFVLLYMVLLGRTVLARPETPGLTAYDDALTAFLENGLQPEYIALLGLPIAAAVAAKGITTGKVIRQELLKAPSGGDRGTSRGLAEVISNDAGHTDLLDFQYFAFNLIALTYFFVTFIDSSATQPDLGLPTIPPTLLALSGVSTTAYLVKKQMETGLAPVVTSVTPMRINLGIDRSLTIRGSGFMAQGKTDRSAFNEVLLDGRPLNSVQWSPTSVSALLPVGTSEQIRNQLGWTDRPIPKLATLTVRDDSGVGSPLVEVELCAPDERPQLPTQNRPIAQDAGTPEPQQSSEADPTEPQG